MSSKKYFSDRQGYKIPEKEITVRDGAPQNLRFFVMKSALELDIESSELLDIICKILRHPPDTRFRYGDDAWPYALRLIEGCEWFFVYNVIEAIHNRLLKWGSGDRAERFADYLNKFFEDAGIGWQLVNGEIVTRGSEIFEATAQKAILELQKSKRVTAAKHIHEALNDLSRRPSPDLSGAITHAMGSLECVARDITGESKFTLGEILKKHPNLLPSPLDTALSKIWGYASEIARHVSEGEEPRQEETELLVSLAATTATYLTRKFPKM